MLSQLHLVAIILSTCDSITTVCDIHTIGQTNFLHVGTILYFVTITLCGKYVLYFS